MTRALALVSAALVAMVLIGCGDDDTDAAYDRAAATARAWSASQTATRARGGATRTVTATRTPAAGVTGGATRTFTATRTPTRTAANPTNTPTQPAQAGSGYETLLGEQFSSSAMLAFIRANDCQAGFASSSSYLCYSAGMELKFNGANRLSLIIFRPAGGAWKQFTGNLPVGLKWSDARASAESKLGAPIAVQPGAYGNPGSATYRGGTVVVTYDFTDGDPPPTAGIRDVRLLWK